MIVIIVGIPIPTQNRLISLMVKQDNEHTFHENIVKSTRINYLLLLLLLHLQKYIHLFRNIYNLYCTCIIKVENFLNRHTRKSGKMLSKGLNPGQYLLTLLAQLHSVVLAKSRKLFLDHQMLDLKVGGFKYLTFCFLSWE